MAKNKVISGDYSGKEVSLSLETVSIGAIKINKSTVLDYETIDENYKKSAVSAVGRATAGALLLGPVGLVAGLTAKNKGTHILAIHFKDGKNSLIEVNDKINKAIIKALF